MHTIRSFYVKWKCVCQKSNAAIYAMTSAVFLSPFELQEHLRVSMDKEQLQIINAYITYHIFTCNPWCVSMVKQNGFQCKS